MKYIPLVTATRERWGLDRAVSEERQRGATGTAESVTDAPGDHRAVADGPSSRARFARRHRTEAIVVAALFVVFTVLATRFPPNGDDWAWGSQLGVTRLNRFFAGYNGRYAANLVVLALTRLPILAAIVVGAGLTATLHLVLAITRNRSPWGYAVATALFLAMPHSLWAQAISWLSGYTNYGLGTLWVLIFLRAVQLDWGKKANGSLTWTRAACIVAFAFFASLFMENITLFFVVASVVVAGAQRHVFGRVSRSAWSWAAGFAIGAVAMFSNSAYRRAAAGTQAYQKVTGLHGALKKALEPISGFAVVDNMVVNLAVATLVALLTVCVVRSSTTRSLRVSVPAVLTGLSVVIAVSLVTAEQSVRVTPVWQRLGGLAAALLVAALCTTALWLVRDAARRATLLCLVGSSLLLLGPLVMVYPIGPRCFYVSYIILLAIVSVLLREVSDQLGRDALSSLGAVGAAVTLGLFASYFAVYVPMAHAADRRLTYVRHQIASGATEITVQRLPFTAYEHVPDPERGMWAHRYELYYGLPDVTIKLAPTPR